jgi:hypothetical protein
VYELHSVKIASSRFELCGCTDVIEGSGRVYEAPCAPGIKKIVQMCYEVSQASINDF